MKKAGKEFVLPDLEIISFIVAHVFLMLCLCRLKYVNLAHRISFPRILL